MIRRAARKAKRIIKRILRIGNYQNIDVFRQWIEEVEPTVWNQGVLSYAPLISVVVPVYNVSSQMLRDCIDSVRKQTYENWELILVDDHSSWENVRQVLSAEDPCDLSGRKRQYFRGDQYRTCTSARGVHCLYGL